MIPGISFGNMNSGPAVINAHLQDRALREQAIREMAGSIANSINLGADRRSQEQLAHDKLAQDLILAREQMQNTKDIAGQESADRRYGIDTNYNLGSANLDLDRIIRTGQLDLGRGELGLHRAVFDYGKGQDIIKNQLSRDELNLRDRLGTAELGLKGRGLDIEQQNADVNFNRSVEDILNNRAMLPLQQGLIEAQTDDARSQAAYRKSQADMGGFTLHDIANLGLNFGKQAAGGVPVDPKSVGSISPVLGKVAETANTGAADQKFKDYVTSVFSPDGEGSLTSKMIKAYVTNPANLYEHLSPANKEIINSLMSNPNRSIMIINGKPTMLDSDFFKGLYPSEGSPNINLNLPEPNLQIMNKDLNNVNNSFLSKIFKYL